MMSELPPHILINVDTEGEIGKVTYTVPPQALAALLLAARVERPTELPESVARSLCRDATNSGFEKIMEESERLNPGHVSQIYTDEDGVVREVRASDVGYDLMKRLVPSSDAEDARLDAMCDPAYNTVDFELRVKETRPDDEDILHPLGQCVLQMRLEPPNLAN